MSARPRRDPRGLVMSPGRRIPRTEPGVRRAAEADPAVVPPAELRRALEKAGGEISRLTDTVSACTACARCDGPRVHGSGPPLAVVLLVKGRPSTADATAGTAFVSEAEALGRAFDRLGVPRSWVRGTSAVRCGDGPATADQVQACAGHLLTEVETVSPRVVVAFGPAAVEAVRALDGKCGIEFPPDLSQGSPVELRPGLSLLATEDLPAGVTSPDAKRRLWRDLQTLPSVLGSTST